MLSDNKRHGVALPFACKVHSVSAPGQDGPASVPLNVHRPLAFASTGSRVSTPPLLAIYGVSWLQNKTSQ